MASTNIINAVFGSGICAVTTSAFRANYGMKLRFSGIDLPTAFEVDFSNYDVMGRDSITMIGQNGEVQIPDDLWDSGLNIYAYVYLHPTDDSGVTVYTVTIPVLGRPNRTEETPTPHEQTVIEQAISALNDAVEQTAADVETTTANADRAAQSEANASASERAAAASASAALASQNAAESAQQSATESASASAESARNAANSAAQAAQSATDAQESAEQAERSVQSIGDDVERSERAAQTATEKATEAASSASTASNKATEASASATAAAQSAQSASTAAQNAAESEQSAESHATDAEQSKTDAQDAQAAAEQAAQSVSGLSEQIEQNTSDIAELVQTKAGALIDTVSGSIASFYPDATVPTVKGLTVNVEPIQDLHGYDNPWPAGGGKNLLAPASIGKVNDSGITVTLTAAELNGYTATKAEVTGTAANWGWRLYQVGIRDIVQPNTAYRLTFIANAQYNLALNLCSAASQHTLSGNKVFTCTSIGSGLYQYSCEFTTYAADNDGWNYTNQVILFFSSPAMLSPVTITIINNFCLTLQSDPEGWTPYSNICPISGWDEVDVWDDPKYGGTIKWNQLIVNGNFDSNAGWSVSANDSLTIANNVATYRASARYHSIVQGTQPNEFSPQAGHVYLGFITAKSYTNSGTVFYIRNVANGSVVQTATKTLTDTQKFVGQIIKLNQKGSQIQFMVQDNNASGFGDITVEKAQMFDLTAMLGSTVADYIYNLERATTGAGVAYFRNLFPKDYYPHDDSYTETCVSAVNGDQYLHYTIQLGQTVYGGTVDAVQGKMVVDRAMVVFDGSSDESWSFMQYTSTSSRAYIAVQGIDVSTADIAIADLMSNVYPTSAYNSQSVLPRITGRYNIEQINVFVPTTTREEFISSLASEPLQVVYKLATPITVDLTPIEVAVLTGQTNKIWADSGDVSVEYAADLKTYIDNKIAAAVAALS